MGKTRKISTREVSIEEAKRIIMDENGNFILYHTAKGDIIFSGINKKGGITLIELSPIEYGMLMTKVGEKNALMSNKNNQTKNQSYEINTKRSNNRRNTFR